MNDADGSIVHSSASDCVYRSLQNGEASRQHCSHVNIRMNILLSPLWAIVCDL